MDKIWMESNIVTDAPSTFLSVNISTSFIFKNIIEGKKFLIVYHRPIQLWKSTENNENIRKRLENYKKLNRKQARKKMKTQEIAASDKIYCCTLNLQTTLPFPKISKSTDIINAIYIFISLWSISLIIMWDTYAPLMK